MTLAGIDRLVHHATILEMIVESYRRRAALQPKARPGPTTSARDKKGKRLIVAARQSTLLLSDNKILAKRDHRHDHFFATGRRLTLRLPHPFSSRLSRNTKL